MVCQHGRMRILVLGGTRFAGRAIVDAALGRGDSVTLFNRGKSNPGLYPGVETVVGDRTVDLSPQGMLLRSDEGVDEGTSLVVSFQATDLPIWFDTCATLTRIVEGRRPGDPGRALGVKFETLPAVSRLILRGFLRKHPATLAQRELPLDLALAQPETIDYARAVLLA